MARRRGRSGGVLCDLALGRLAASGLSAEDGAALGLSSLAGAETSALCPKFPALRSLRIPYWDPAGGALEDVPGGGQFYRLRYLEDPPGFGAIVDAKPRRYTQPPGTLPAAYFPRGLGVEWPRVCADPGEPLVLTEGELKSAKACREGFPTVGLGGVYNWRAPRSGVVWLASLDLVRWVRRAVYVAFDSDLRTNKAVQAALADLTAALERRGAFVYLAALPALEGLAKVGLDDFLVKEGRAALADLLHEAEPLGLARPLWDMNERFTYVRDPGLVWDRARRAKVGPSAFREHYQSAEEYHEKVARGDSVTYEPTSAAAAWLRWPLRSEAERLTYAPGRPERVDGALNVWPGWGVEARRGDARPFLRLLDHLFTGAEPGAREWFERWCAYPLQHPGTKLFTAAVVHGIFHGTGKSFVGYVLGRIYGRNFTEISEMDLHNQFNEWAEAKQLVMGDDVTGRDRRADADFLKKLVTQREMRVNTKYIPTYVVPDCVNYYFTSQHPDCFFLEEGDRRFFVHEVTVGPLPEEFYVEFDLWLESGGAAHVFDYLLRLDLGGFNPAAPAFRTAAKDRMTATVRSDLAAWVRQLRDSPRQTLRLGEVELRRDLYTARELLQIYDPERSTGTTANGLGRELSRAGVRQVLGGVPLRLADGTQGRYYAVRNAERWLTAPAARLAEHVQSAEEQQGRKAKY